MPEVAEFDRHLDECKQCREQAFNLCEKGWYLLHKAAADLNPKLKIGQPSQWNDIINNSHKEKV